MSLAERTARRQAIRRLLTSREISTQDELGELLSREGFTVTQATLSRDLASVGAVRAALPGGGTRYALEEAPSSHLRARELGELILDIDDNGMLVAIRTVPGAASAVASAVDGLRLPGLLGTVAGDDTLFCAPARKQTARALRTSLLSLFGKVE